MCTKKGCGGLYALPRQRKIMPWSRGKPSDTRGTADARPALNDLQGYHRRNGGGYPKKLPCKEVENFCQGFPDRIGPGP